MSRRRIVIAVLALALMVGAGLGWYTFFGPCGKSRVSRAGDAMSEIFDQWTDAVSLAQNTARIGLSGPIGDLQDLKRQMEAVDVPDCLRVVRDGIAGGMDYAIDGFLGFAAQADDSRVGADFDTAIGMFEAATDNLVRIRQCAPTCP